jgi:hypothetical protein
MNIDQLLDQIDALPSNWHGVGSVSTKVLRGIARHASAIGEIQCSVETGSGKTTLLFSHLSQAHTAFALNQGDSIAVVKNSPLFNANRVTYVEGCTHLTLPQHSFDKNIQIALIDGPHAYPFHDLEYFYFYPRLDKGGLLIVDDINIPSVKRMHEVIAADDMFRLLEVIGNTAFFQRTDAPLFDPQGSWGKQGYNKEFYTRMKEGAKSKPFSIFGITFGNR